MASTASADGRALRQRHIEALSRRAALHQGPVRSLLDERLRVLQAAAAAEAGLHETSSRPNPNPNPSSPPGPLAGLLAHIARRSAQADESDALSTGLNGHSGTAASPGHRELRAVRDYRSTWSRLSVEQRVSQALARVPRNAGPLNTQRLVHQALSVLRDASPAYLHRLVLQVEALLWLEQLGQGAPGKTAKKKPRAGAAGAAVRQITRTTAARRNFDNKALRAADIAQSVGAGAEGRLKRGIGARPCTAHGGSQAAALHVGTPPSAKCGSPAALQTCAMPR